MLIVTRHSGLVDFLKKQGITGRVIPHATPDDIAGQDVVGVLPISLAALASSVTIVNMNVPQELRGQDLTSEQMEELGARLEKYVVRRVE